MLTIRMQRAGRKGYATYRVVVQDSRFSPSSGRVVAQLGNYNPHTKESSINTEKVSEYLKNGAQPSPRVVRLLEEAKVKLPNWVVRTKKGKKAATKNAEKLRKHQPKEEPAPQVEEAPASEEATEKTEEVSVEPEAAEASKEVAAEAPAEDTKTEEAKEENTDTPAEEPASTDETKESATE